MKRFLVYIISWFIPIVGISGTDARPWTFWYWMYGAVSKAGIHADLQGMKDIGLGGCYLMPIRGVSDRPEFHGHANQLSPEFWKMVDYTFQQADSLGLEMGIHICDGFALGGGPWVTPAESMQKVVWTDTIVSGDLIGTFIKRPEVYKGYEEDIAVLAFPVKCTETKTFRLTDSPFVRTGGGIVKTEKGLFRSETPGFILFDLKHIETVRSLEIVPLGNNIQSQRLKVEISNDGINFHLVKELRPARQGWQSTGYSFTYALPPTTARYFRFEWTPEGTEPGAEDLDAAKWKPVLKLKDIVLSSESKIGQWRGKAAYTWLVAPETTSREVADADCVQLSDEVRLTLSGDRIVSCSSTKSHFGAVKWHVFRFGHTSTGQMNVTAGGGKGLEVDKFNAGAVDQLFDQWFQRFLNRPHAQVIKMLHVDSWECGSQNWGKNFAAEFQNRHGYDLLPYLPLYAGIPMVSAQISERVLRDIRKTVNNLVNDNFFKTLEKRAHVYGKLVSHESIAPTFVADGIEHYKYADLPMGEFWLNSPTHDKPDDMLDAVSGAHIYGKNIVQAEGFTEVRGVWNETPAVLKPLLDLNFTLGMNRLFFHVDVHNPWTNLKPGMTLDGIGLFFQRDNTWYGQARGIVDYITRSQRLLQKGVPVTDIAVFTGEEMPRRSLSPDHIVGILPGIFGRQCVERERKRMNNAGQPMFESPVGVVHSVGILDLRSWANALRGYQYDSMSPDALKNAVCVKDGSLLTKGGIQYHVLVIPGKIPMDPSFSGLSGQVRKRVDEFRRSGGIIIDRPYRNDDFSGLGLPRDVILPEQIAYTHRRTDSTEIYFLSNQTATTRDFLASFRVSGREPECYDALENVWFRPDSWRRGAYRTSVNIHLDAYGSLFVIFPKVACSLSKLGKLLYHDNVNGTWKIHFNAIGKDTVSATLFDWSKSSDERIKYYSGTTSYQTTFYFRKGNGPKVELWLGVVNDVAHIYVNGIDCGIAWTTPYKVDISKAVHLGQNSLRIEVVNTWANALKGSDLGKAPYKGIWTNAKYRLKGNGLLSAGLLGPVEIRY